MDDNKKNCILTDYRKDGKGCSCGELCPHRIILHGLDGISGRVGASGIPRQYQYITPKTSRAREGNPKLYDIVDRYVQTFKTGNVKSLYLWSKSPGTGKTTTASAIMNAWIAYEYLSNVKQGRQPQKNSTMFLDVNAFQTKFNLHSMAKEEEGMTSIRETIIRAQQADFAVLDDVGVRSSTDAFRSYLHDIVNYRVSNELPTIYTSNFAIEGMREVYDDRLYDRMREQCISLHFDGESHRGIRK